MIIDCDAKYKPVTEEDHKMAKNLGESCFIAFKRMFENSAKGISFLFVDDNNVFHTIEITKGSGEEGIYFADSD